MISSEVIPNTPVAGLRLLGRRCIRSYPSSLSSCLEYHCLVPCLSPLCTSACLFRRRSFCALVMADSNLNNVPSDDERYAADEKHISTPSSISGQRTPEAVAADYGLSEKKLLRKLDLYLVPGVAVSPTENA
jgi:hypothetical protein